MSEFPIPSGLSPGSIAPGKDGNLWFTEAGRRNSIGRVAPEGSVAEYLIPTAARDPYGIAAGPDGNIWFTELSANKIGRISNRQRGRQRSFKVTPHVCVLATSGDPRTCSSDDKCWCSGEGAKCDATSHACSLIVHDGAR